MTKEQIGIIVDMYRDGRNYTKIANSIGTSVYTVKRWVRLNRDEYELKRRRAVNEKTNAISLAAELTTTWNLKLSKTYLRKAWGQKA